MFWEKKKGKKERKIDSETIQKNLKLFEIKYLSEKVIIPIVEITLNKYSK